MSSNRWLSIALLPLASLLASNGFAVDVPTAEVARRAPAAEYQLVPLGSLGGSFTYPRSHNASHQVVGLSFLTNGLDGPSHAFLWSPSSDGGLGGAMVDLGTLGGRNSYASGINSRGQVVGAAQNAKGQRVAFLWNPVGPNATTGVMHPLPTVDGVAPDSANSINTLGQIVGTAGGKGFLFTPNSPNGTTGTMTGFDQITPWSINDRGQFAGESQSPFRQAFVFTPDKPNGATGRIDFVPFPEGMEVSRAADLNDAGDLCGDASGPGTTRGFLRLGKSHALLDTEGSRLNALTNGPSPIAVGSYADTDIYPPPTGLLVRAGQEIHLDTLVGVPPNELRPGSGPFSVQEGTHIATDGSVTAVYGSVSNREHNAGLLVRSPVSPIGIRVLPKTVESLIGKSTFRFKVTNTSARRRIVKVTLSIDQRFPRIVEFSPASGYRGPGRATTPGVGTLAVSRISVGPRQTVTGSHSITSTAVGNFRLFGWVETDDQRPKEGSGAAPISLAVVGPLPADVTDSVRIQRGPQVPEKGSNAVTQQITITNAPPKPTRPAGDDAIEGPFYVIADEVSAGIMDPEDGKTANVGTLGSPYRRIKQITLKPNGQISATLRLRRPEGSDAAVEYGVRVLAGPGIP